jgi:excisionase family DNA binding protein
MHSNHERGLPMETDAKAGARPALSVVPDSELERLLTPLQAAEYLGLTYPTLQRMRTKGGGPAYVKLGKRRIAYPESNLKAWVKGRVATSTADARVRGLAA